MKRWLTGILCVVGAAALLALGYGAYVFLGDSRIPDYQTLQVRGGAEQKALSAGQSCTAVTYNVGFGAYLPDYSFFMDGGTESRCKSKASAAESIRQAGTLALAQQPDFALFQEVDTDATRSYHVNQRGLLQDVFDGYDEIFAQNYHSPYLLYPFSQPIGASDSGMALFSRYDLWGNVRRSLPVDAGVSRILDLDRCYSVSRVAVDNGRELVIYNVHLSAYSRGSDTMERQVRMLMNDISEAVQKGSYVLCGGDFNHDLLKAETDTSDNDLGWARAFSRDMLPAGVSFAIDLLSPQQRAALRPSARNANEPYNPETTFTLTLDGFLLSDNLTLEGYETVSTGFLYSDHDPVRVTFRLNP